MACNTKLPSDPEFLLQYMEDMDSDLSDDEFDGYVEEQGNDVCVDEVTTTDVGMHEAMQVDVCEEALEEGTGEAVMVMEVAAEEEIMMDEAAEEEASHLIPPFRTKTGVSKDMSSYEPVDFFLELFPKELIAYIVKETNRYGQQYMDSHAAYLAQHPKARANQFKGKPIVVQDIKKFLALVIAMGIVNMPDMQQYWSTTWPFTSTNFSSIMSRDRFLLVLKFLHLADNTKMAAKGEHGYDPLYKLRHLLSTLVQSYKKSYTMKKEVSVDESIISYKGRLSFLQYMPKKPHKWGMKAWVLAEAATGYTWNFHLYTGKEEKRPADLPLGTHVVIDLLKDLVGKGHHVYFDNFYTSPQLCKTLLTQGFGSCGTVRLDRKDIPLSFKRKAVQFGQVVYYTDGPLLGLKWMDKRIVSLLTTIHDETMITKTRRIKGAPQGQQVIQKPQGIDEYNKYMGGVDKAGQLVQYYGYNNFAKKWWKRVFFHMVDVTLVNAYILYYTVTTGKCLSHLNFRIAVAKGLLAQTDAEIPTTSNFSADTPARLFGHNHFPEPADGRHDCTVCSNRKAGKRVTTSYRCCTCKAPLCIHPCFKTYHTVMNY